LEVSSLDEISHLPFRGAPQVAKAINAGSGNEVVTELAGGYSVMPDY
jgi:hypothetical protein